MACLPYPTFLTSPTQTNDSLALSATGRVRIHPSCPGAISTSQDPAHYPDVLAKCLAETTLHDDTDENRKLRKLYAKESVALASSYLGSFLGLDVSIVDVEMVLPLQDVMETDGRLACCFLDAGCARIVLEVGRGESIEDALGACDVCRLPRERLVVHFGCEDDFRRVAEEGGRAEIGGRVDTVSVHMNENDVGAMSSVADLVSGCTEGQRIKFVIQLRCNSDDETLFSLVGTFARGINEDQGHVSLVDPTARQLGIAFAQCVKTDRSDGLFTTVVCTRSGEALGLVYSSEESIVAALQSGRGVYYSRSRKSLWRKGDTSGHQQTLHRLDVDCDGDALRFTVTQNGDPTKAFCHLNTLTCWGEPRGLRHLEGVLQQRLRDAPEGSYTKRLFEDSTLLRNKLVEEAQELSEAETKQHVAEELADVLYFAMVRAAKAGVSIDDAVMELDRRARKVTRRQGDSKAYRIQAGEDILNKTKETQKGHQT